MQEDERRKKAEFRKKVRVVLCANRNLVFVRVLNFNWLNDLVDDVWVRWRRKCRISSRTAVCRRRSTHPWGRLRGASCESSTSFSFFFSYLQGANTSRVDSVFFLLSRHPGTMWPKWRVWPPSRSGRMKKADTWCSLKRWALISICSRLHIIHSQ